MARHLLLSIFGFATAVHTASIATTFVSVSLKATRPASFRAQVGSNGRVDVRTIPELLAQSSSRHVVLVDRQQEIERCLGGAVESPPNTDFQLLLAPSDNCDATSDEVCDYLASAAENIGNLRVACVQHVDAAYTANDLTEGRKVADAVNDPLSSRQGCLDLAQVADAWPYMTALKEPKQLIIAILDTGINEEHEDLVNMLWDDGQGHHGFNTDSQTETTFDITDEEGHGTRMAGIVAAQLNNSIGLAGVAGFSFVKIMMLKFVDERAGDQFGPEMRALRIAAEFKADIVLMSLNWYLEEVTKEFEEAIQVAASKMVVIVSAGNGASNIPEYPCAYKETVCVTGTLKDAKVLDPLDNWGSHVTVAAPGDRITTTAIGGHNTYGASSGTSCAAAFVAGVVAMMMAVGAKPENVKQLILDNSDDLSTVPGSPYFIAGGFINAYKVVKAVVGVTNPP